MTRDIPATSSAPQITKSQNTEEQIRNLAYKKWEAAGRPSGDGKKFWEEAEKEIKAQK